MSGTEKRKGRRPKSFEDRLKEIQHEVLVAVATGSDLPQVLELVCTRAEEIAPKAICSILFVDAERRLRPLAAPSLPDSYNQGLDGLAIGPMVGSCGSAAYYGEAVEVKDIRSDTRWIKYRDKALALGLKACWSSPIKSRDGRVVGTFAFYFRSARRPNKSEKRIVALCAHLCAIAIENWEAQARIRHLAYSDCLTHLDNRARLTERFPEIIAEAARSGKQVAVMLADLDDFRTINDLEGQKVGDRLLCMIADRLRMVADGADIVSRLGGDEFLIVETERDGVSGFERLASRLAATLCDRYALDDGREFDVLASLGVACYPRDGKTLDALMAHADTALCRVKRTARGGSAFYSAEMDAEKHAARAFERDLSLAAAAGQLSLVYQPQADSRTGAIRGFEALLRWNHPVHGNVSPAKFIPAAESCGAIVEIGAFVLREALAQAARWPEHLRVAVNVSPFQIVHDDFAQIVSEALAETGVSPKRLEVEVTESLFIQDSVSALSTLERLKALGVSVSIDDFGTGYSSLSTLRSFPFDRIKIDRSFVFDMTTSTEAAAIVNSIMGLGRALGLPVVAEGVETTAQLELLQRLECSEVQGFLIGCPLPISSYAHVTGHEVAAAAEVA